MAGRYRQIVSTPEVLAAQAQYFGRVQNIPPQPERDPLTEEEALFIARRDSFYMATVTSDGWPYVQHRGGEPGFLKVLGPNSLGFADYSGNRQMLSTGNLAGSDRVSLFLMDYPNRERLKILGHAKVLDARDHPGLVERLADEPVRKIVERLFLIDVISFDWNCPKYITPRYTEEEVMRLVEPLQRRITELENRGENS
ncbi:MAG: pyridoxamine 5'-phosphate oxidase family protein [Verrucomicrobia bacterium]|nr:pyridoxamine 5'-phosphate oxidase family protein [Verrucomicrobiota bacterium]